MRLKMVTGPRFYAACLACGEKVLAGDGQNTVADLDGEAYKAYYCERCALSLAAPIQCACSEPGTVVILENGSWCCTITLAKFKAIHGYEYGSKQA